VENLPVRITLRPKKIDEAFHRGYSDHAVNAPASRLIAFGFGAEKFNLLCLPS
jgi:hypothetical protein